jgi:hypothetical protein
MGLISDRIPRPTPRADSVFVKFASPQGENQGLLRSNNSSRTIGARASRLGVENTYEAARSSDSERIDF